MRPGFYLEGPFRHPDRSHFLLAEEALYACGGLALVVFLCYAFIAL